MRTATPMACSRRAHRATSDVTGSHRDPGAEQQTNKQQTNKLGPETRSAARERDTVLGTHRGLGSKPRRRPSLVQRRPYDHPRFVLVILIVTAFAFGFAAGNAAEQATDPAVPTDPAAVSFAEAAALSVVASGQPVRDRVLLRASAASADLGASLGRPG